MGHDDQKNSSSFNLEQIRNEIDSVDQQLQELINRRASGRSGCRSKVCC